MASIPLPNIAAADRARVRRRDQRLTEIVNKSLQYSIKIEYNDYQSLTTEQTYVPSQLTVLVTLTHLMCVLTCALFQHSQTPISSEDWSS